jgi:hypothetical protein
VASFGRTSLAWASMGQGAHRLDVVGPHTGSQRHAFGGLHGIMEDLIQAPSTQTTFLGEAKCHLLRVDVMLEGV